MTSSYEEILENEWHLVRYSGETPEIALHSAIYYITRANDGPRLTLHENQVDMLRQAAVERYLEIILRDLQHANFGTPSYRGFSRSIVNYRRFLVFCERQKICPDKVRRQAADVLQIFLATEIAEVKEKQRKPIINCSHSQLQDFAAELGIDLRGCFSGISDLCLPVDSFL